MHEQLVGEVIDATSSLLPTVHEQLVGEVIDDKVELGDDQGAEFTLPWKEVVAEPGLPNIIVSGQSFQ